MAEEVGYAIDQKIAKPHPPRFTEMQVSPKEANYIVNRYRFPRQRKISPAWAVELGILIDKNELQATSIHFAHCKEDGNIYLVDGYHRLEGLSLADKPYLFPVTHHYCNTLEEVNDVYSKLDQGVPRRMNAALRAHDMGSKLGLPEMYLENVAIATNVIKHNFRATLSGERMRSSSERIHMVEEWHQEAALVHQELLGGNTSIVNTLKNSAFLAVMMALARYQPEKARKFIYDVAHMVGEEGSPAKAMVSAIINRKAKWGRNVAEQSRVMACAWNYFYEGKPLQIATCRDASIPLDLLGTPWAGPKVHNSGPNAGRLILPYQQHFRTVKPKPEAGQEAEGTGK